MSVKQVYTITSLAGRSIAGRRRVQGASTIELTPEEAEFELAAGTIVLSGAPLPTPTPVAAFLGTDTISTSRSGSLREHQVGEFEAYLLTPGRPIAEAIASARGGSVVDTVAPVITTPSAFAVAENTLFTVALAANEPVSWSLVSGAASPDFAAYTLSGNVLSFRADLDDNFEDPDDIDGNNTYIVTVKATDVAGNSSVKQITVTVLDTVEIFAPQNLSPPVVTGTPQQGQTLTATSGVWSDTPSSYTYQFRRDGVPIPNATGSSYALTADDVGKMISVSVTAFNAAGSGSENSGEAGPVIPAAPISLTQPVISGTVQVGQTLTVTDGTWSNGPTSYARQWKRNGTPITNATANTYVPVAADVGTNLTCTVTATNAGGSTSRTSALTAPVLAAGSALAISGTPVTSGTVGSAYTGFSVAGAGGTSPYAYSVQSGSLPPGLSLNASTGAVTGTPTTAGTYAATVLRVTDAANATADLAAFTITVGAAVTPLAITGTPGQATVGSPYSFTPAVTGGSGTKSYTLSGTLPAGMSFSSSTGAVTGTPTTVGTASNLSITVTDQSGSAVLSNLSIPVQAAGGLLLDTLSVQPAMALSLRKLRSAYSGPCLRVRRSVDSLEQDIGFDSSGVIDLAALSAFVGTTTSSDGFVVTWYDQSVNLKHATQSVAANQPFIVKSGVVQASNNRPKILFSGTNMALAYDLDAGRSVRSVRMVAEHRVSSVSSLLTGVATGALTVRFKGTGKNLEIVKTGGSIIATSTAAVGASVPSTLAMDFDAGSGAFSLNIDGGTATTGTSAQTLTTGSGTLIGGGTVNMAAQALMEFNAVLSQADSDKIQASQKAYYATA